MLFNDQETQRIVTAIRNGAEKFTSAELRHALTIARRGKPERFDEICEKTQELYGGRGKPLLEEALLAAFPNTPITEFPRDVLPLMKMYARIDAGVYKRAPDRWLEDENKKRVEGEPAELWTWALRKSLFNSKMQEAERRTLIPPTCLIGEIAWLKNPDTDEFEPVLRWYWPKDVEVLCHWQASTSWKHKWMVALKQPPPTPTAKGTWWKTWSREPPETIDGSFGDWFVSYSSDQGEQAQMQGAPVRYGKIAPLFLIQPNDPEGHIFSLVDSDLVDLVLNLSVQRADEGYTLRKQGHAQTWTDDITEVAQVASGAGVMWRVNQGRVINTIAYNAPLEGHLSSRRQRQRETAIARGNSPHAYDDMGSVPPSGIAKKIDNLTHDERVAESAEIFQRIEEEGPLAILLDVVRRFHPKGSLLNGLTARMQPKRAPVLEDPSQKQQRMKQAVDAGWITDARAAFEVDLYDTIEEAEEAIGAIDDAKPPPPALPPPPPLPTRSGEQNGGQNGPGKAGPPDGSDSGEPKPGAG